MKNKYMLKASVLLLCSSISHHVFANNQFTPEDLGVRLTPIGATIEGNESGIIPKWSGGLPTDAAAINNGFLTNPFEDDKPLFTIDINNYQDHIESLTPGQVALFKRYPETYKMHIYETRRSVGFPQSVYEGALKSALNTQLINDGNGLTNFEHDQSYAFPLPSTGVEVVWNHLTRYRGSSHIRYVASAAPQTNGSFSIVRMREDVALPNYINAGSGSTVSNNILLYVKQTVTQPTRLSGTVILVIDTLDQVAEPRMAWLYNAGQRRVRRAPQISYDGPGTGSDGMRTVDNFELFNGAPDRYDWTLVGKREIYIPYNSYKLESPSLSYGDIIKAGHLNPEHNRYELHRVWEVVASLKDGQRHIYHKRHMFINEDTWKISVADHYDGRDQLWRVAEGHISHHYEEQVPIYSAEVTHDLLAGRYMVIGLKNDESSGIQFGQNFSTSDFTPHSLRSSGIR